MRAPGVSSSASATSSSGLLPASSPTPKGAPNSTTSSTTWRCWFTLIGYTPRWRPRKPYSEIARPNASASPRTRAARMSEKRTRSGVRSPRRSRSTSRSRRSMLGPPSAPGRTSTRPRSLTVKNPAPQLLTPYSSALSVIVQPCILVGLDPAPPGAELHHQPALVQDDAPARECVFARSALVAPPDAPGRPGGRSCESPADRRDDAVRNCTPLIRSSSERRFQPHEWDRRRAHEAVVRGHPSDARPVEVEDAPARFDSTGGSV